MKNALLMALALGGALLAIEPTQAQTPQPSKKDMKRKEKERKKTGPEVYKGTVAEQNRIVTDAPGAEKDAGDGDEASTKKVKRKN